MQVSLVVLLFYIVINLVISSLNVGTFKSLYKTLLATYRGAFTIARRTLF
jgi:hypothetical protein